MRRPELTRCASWLLSWLLVAARLVAADAPEAATKPESSAGQYLRVTRDDTGQPRTLETAIVRFVPAKRQPAQREAVVDLIGALHVGEKSYYAALNKEFENYDVVLYELVAPPGTRVPRGGGQSAHPVALLQGGMKNMLGLELQVEQIDYQRDNLVHADMSPEDFAKSMEKRGDNFFALFFRMLGQSIAQKSKRQVQAQAQPGRRATNDLDVLAALFDPRRSDKLKQLMAEQFADMDGALGALEGPGGSTLITERNKVALQGLRAQLDGGKKKIAIFYGAGHMRDMEQRLVADFNLRRDNERWLVAWDLAPKKQRPKSKTGATSPTDPSAQEAPEPAANGTR